MVTERDRELRQMQTDVAIDRLIEELRRTAKRLGETVDELDRRRRQEVQRGNG